MIACLLLPSAPPSPLFCLSSVYRLISIVFFLPTIREHPFVASIRCLPTPAFTPLTPPSPLILSSSQVRYSEIKDEMNTLSQNYFRKIETFEESFKAASQQLEIELISKLHAGLLDDLLPETKVGFPKRARR